MARWAMWVDGIFFHGNGFKLWYSDENDRWHELPDLKKPKFYYGGKELREIARRLKEQGIKSSQENDRIERS